MTMQYDDPYDPNKEDFENEEPLLDKVLKDTIDEHFKDVHTAIPGKIVKFTPPNIVAVQPLLKRMYKDGKAVDLPIIQNCPILMPRGANYYVKLPVAVNDTGLLLFSERSLDKWLISGGSVDPMDVRKFDLSDGMFLPGLYPFSEPISDVTTDLIAHNGTAEARIKAAGEVDLIAPTKVSLQRALNAVLSEPLLMGTTVQTALSALLQNAIDTDTQNQILTATLITLAGSYALHNHPGDPNNPPSDAAAWAAGAVTITAVQTAISALQAALTLLKANPIDSGAILSALSFTEK